MSQAGTPFSASTGAGFFSSARRLRLPPGPHAEPGRVRGYHLDLRAKAPPLARLDPDALPVGSGFVAVAQAGLGYHERHLAGEGDGNLEAALLLGRHLFRSQERGPGPHRGGFEHRFAYRHGARLEPGWLSAMAQGQAASLFVRLALATGEERFAEAAVAALAPFDVPVEEGGVAGRLAGRPFPEEYPTTPQSHVLNGGVFALWGLHDVGAGLGLSAWGERFEEGVDALASSLPDWDLGWWSRYDLFPHPFPVRVNVASSFYQALHADQLDALARLTGERRLAAAAETFLAQLRSPASRARAFAGKVAFRLVVRRRPVAPPRR